MPSPLSHPSYPPVAAHPLPTFTSSMPAALSDPSFAPSRHPHPKSPISVSAASLDTTSCTCPPIGTVSKYLWISAIKHSPIPNHPHRGPKQLHLLKSPKSAFIHSGSTDSHTRAATDD